MRDLVDRLAAEEQSVSTTPSAVYQVLVDPDVGERGFLINPRSLNLASSRASRLRLLFHQLTEPTRSQSSRVRGLPNPPSTGLPSLEPLNAILRVLSVGPVSI